MKREKIPPECDQVIEARTSLLDVNLNDVWRYRDLLWMLVKRDFVSKAAMHVNCQPCHKKTAAEDQKAPTRCAGCHPQ